MATPSTREKGHPGGAAQSFVPNRRPGSGGSVWTVDPLETNPELRFPNSVAVYDKLRSQDGEVGAVLSAITLPLIGAQWDLKTEGVDQEVVDMVREDLGLPAAGEARVRTGETGVSWTEHVASVAETFLWAGFAPFEQVYRVSDERVHLKKLAPRPPRTIREIEVSRDGGLKAIYQEKNDRFAMDDQRIGVDNLVFYVHRREGADWSGRSILRQAYKHWLIKDVLIRLDAQVAERNGMGIPVITYQNEELKTAAEEAVAAFRAGESAGLALPNGCDVQVVGTSGSTVDLISRIEYHDRMIARSALAMFLNLGHDNGARSLGETFLDVFTDSVQTVANQIAETATEHIIRDLVHLNYGPGTPYPTLTAGNLKANQGITVEHLTSLVSNGVIRADDKLEDFLRSEHGLPGRDTESVRDPQSAEFSGALVRAGFDPQASAQKAGLGDLPHTGLAPVTVQNPGENAPTPPQDGGPAELPGMSELLAELTEERRARRRWYTQKPEKQ